MPEPLLVAKAGAKDLCLLPGLANRHGLITGATGTGKTVTMQVLAESFARIGVPTFMADVKGDFSGISAPVSDMGPLLLARLLGLNDTQGGVLTAVFKIADDNGLLLLDLKDLRAMLQFVGDNAARFKTQYGNISASSVRAIH